MMDDYQVWHKEGEHYRHVADVAAADPQTVALKTQHGLLAARWQDGQGVTAMPGEQRSTEFGDIVLAPDGTEYKFAGLKLEGHYGTVPGFELTHELREQLYAEWIADRSQRDLHDRSVDFSDRDSHAMLGEIIGDQSVSREPPASPSDYERSLKQAIERTGFRASDEQRAKTL
jgi:hypothetical protein